MTKKITADDLTAISDRMKRTMTLREGTARAKVFVHMGTCGIAAGSRGVMKALMDELEKSGATDIVITSSSCAGLCSREPMITVEIQNEAPVKYVDLTPDKVREVFNSHAVGGKIVTEYALAHGSERMA